MRGRSASLSSPARRKTSWSRTARYIVAAGLDQERRAGGRRAIERRLEHVLEKRCHQSRTPPADAPTKGSRRASLGSSWPVRAIDEADLNRDEAGGAPPA